MADDASGIDTSGTFQLPTDFLLELQIAVSAGMDLEPGNFFLKQLGVYASGWFISVGYQPGSGPAVDVATAMISRPLFQHNSVYALGGLPPFDDIVGKVMIGNITSIDQQPAGLFAFTFAEGRLDPDCIRPIIRGVSALILNNNGQLSTPIYGDVQLVAGTNCLLTPVLLDGQDPQIVINAISGDGTVQTCECVGSAAAGPPITNINGITPREDGTFTLSGNECVTLNPITNGLEIVDTCSQPCCSCADLEAITNDLERLYAEAQAVQNFVNTLAANVNTMSATVLGARLNDRPCFTS